MAIVFQRAGGTGGSSTHTIDIGAAGNDRLIIIMGALEGTTALTDVTVDGKSAQFIGLAQNILSGSNHSEMWAIDEDALGASAGSVVCSLVGGSSSWGINVAVYYGFHGGVAYFSTKDATSISPDGEVTPGLIDIPANGLLEFLASHGTSGTWVDADWDTSPTEATDDGKTEIEMTEDTDGSNPFSAIMGTAHFISTGAKDTVRQLRAHASTDPFNRGTGVLASFLEKDEWGGAFIRTKVDSASLTNVTAHTVTLPPGIVSGDLILIFFTCDSNTSITFPSEGTAWIVLKDIAESTSIRTKVCFRDADGTEGASISVTTGTAQNSASCAFRIEGHSTTQDPEASTGTTGTDINPNPDNLTPTGGAKNYLWFAYAGHDFDRLLDPDTDWPSSYGHGKMQRRASVGVDSAGTFAVGRLLNAASENPGQFTMNVADNWVAGTIVVHPAGAVDFPMDAAPGSYAVTGLAAEPLAGYLAVATAGGYTLSGLDAEILFGAAMDAGPGSYALTGPDAEILLGAVMDADPGSYALSGLAAELLLGAFLNAAAGGYTLTGLDASVDRGFPFNAEAGSYALSGLLAEILADRSLEGGALAGAYAVSGLDASLDRGFPLNAEPGSYAVSGAAATLLRGLLLSVDPGSYAISGLDATLRQGFILVLDSGVYAVSGMDTTLLRGIVLDAGPGAYVVTGFLAELIFAGVGAFEMAADPGIYAVSGLAASLLAGIIANAEAGVYAVSGIAANLDRGYPLNAAPGAYAVSGLPATIPAGRFLSADLATYAVSGAPATLLRDALLSADPGSLALSGLPAGILAGFALSGGALAGVYVVSGLDAALARGYLFDAESGAYSLAGADASFLRTFIIQVEPGVYITTGLAATLVRAGINPFVTTRSLRRPLHG